MSQGVQKVLQVYLLGQDRTLARGRHPRPPPLAQILLVALLGVPLGILSWVHRVLRGCFRTCKGKRSVSFPLPLTYGAGPSSHYPAAPRPEDRSVSPALTYGDLKGDWLVSIFPVDH